MGELPRDLYSHGSTGKIPGGIQCLPPTFQLMEKCWEQRHPHKKISKNLKISKINGVFQAG